MGARCLVPLVEAAEKKRALEEVVFTPGPNGWLSLSVVLSLSPFSFLLGRRKARFHEPGC